MKLLFLARRVYPYIGGVEKHVHEISKSLKLKGYEIRTISEKDIKYPKLKFIGIFYIWLWLFKNRKLIEKCDIVHCHDVFVWYLPFRILYFNKPVYTTFHGWEGVYPIPLKNIIIKRLSAKLSWGNICIGRYIEKFYGIKANIISYQAYTPSLKFSNKNIKKNTKKIVYVGRLENDTGILKFIKWLNKNKGFTVDFCGDGYLREECSRYGIVHGFTDPRPFLQKATICIPGGYLSYIEAKHYGCKTILFPDNPLKKYCFDEIKKIKKFPTWDKVADEYIRLYNNT